MQCPHCQTQMEIPDLWEFFDCTNCGSSLQLENNELKILKTPNGSSSTSFPQSAVQEKEKNQTEPLLENQEAQNFSDTDSQPPTTAEETPFSPENDETLQNNDHSSPTESPSETAHEDFSETPHPQPLESSLENKDEQVESENPSPPTENDENLSQILDFNNSPHQKNHFTYQLQISEILSQAVFDKIQGFLKSPRIKLDLPKQTTNKTLVVNNLNAVQMVYIVRKLSPLPVQIHWQQKSTLTK